ncbi:hypothetical protein GCM10022254_56250 [Actinomadura meridiana]|uniref:Uncharacterized protein n=1 Tax=Actinomadura meridiana TaxID=559626 RepID=A0ABP8CG61_9ACTN
MNAERSHGALRLPEGSWWDWEVMSWGGARFQLAADFDLTYHHGLELNFSTPLYVSCPSTFHDPVFRASTREESSSIARRLGEEPPVLVAFDADAGGREPLPCLIAAERLDIVHETVLRYWREDAAPDQRFASWVHPPTG